MSEVTRYNTESSYPTEIDDLLCLSDVDLEQLPISRNHQTLLAASRYTEAGELLESSDIDSLCGSLFRLIENRIYATQSYLLQKNTKWYEVHGVQSPFEYFSEPTDKTKKPVWTNIEDLSRVNIGSLSGDYTLSQTGGFRP